MSADQDQHCFILSLIPHCMLGNLFTFLLSSVDFFLKKKENFSKSSFQNIVSNGPIPVETVNLLFRLSADIMSKVVTY